MITYRFVGNIYANICLIRILISALFNIISEHLEIIAIKRDQLNKV